MMEPPPQKMRVIGSSQVSDMIQQRQRPNHMSIGLTVNANILPTWGMKALCSPRQPIGSAPHQNDLRKGVQQTVAELHPVQTSNETITATAALSRKRSSRWDMVGKSTCSTQTQMEYVEKSMYDRQQNLFDKCSEWNVELLKKNQDLTTNLEKGKNEADDQKKKVTELQIANEKLEKKLLDDVGHWKVEYEALNSENQEWSILHAETIKKHKAVVLEYEEKIKKFQEGRIDLERKAKELCQKDQKIIDLEARIKKDRIDHEVKIKSLNADLKEARAKGVDQGRTIKKLETDAKKLRGGAAELEIVRSELAASETKFENLSNDLKTNKEALVELEGHKVEAENECQKLKAALVRSGESQQKVEEDLANVKSERQELERKCRHYHNRIKSFFICLGNPTTKAQQVVLNFDARVQEDVRKWLKNYLTSLIGQLDENSRADVADVVTLDE